MAIASREPGFALIVKGVACPRTMRSGKKMRAVISLSFSFAVGERCSLSARLGVAAGVRLMLGSSAPSGSPSAFFARALAEPSSPLLALVLSGWSALSSELAALVENGVFIVLIRFGGPYGSPGGSESAASALGAQPVVIMKSENKTMFPISLTFKALVKSECLLPTI